MRNLWLRAEISPYEHRAPLSPNDAKILIEKNINVIVENSPQRIFKDEEYQKAGCKLVSADSWQIADPKNTLVLGLKRFKQPFRAIQHTHMFFAHAFKNQPGARELLHSFAAGNGILYDIEYMIDENQQRVASFSYYAGYCATAVALICWCKKLTKSTNSYIKPFNSKAELNIFMNSINTTSIPTILILGDGNCGKGAATFLSEFQIPFKQLSNHKIKGGHIHDEIKNAPIIVNAFSTREKNIIGAITNEIIKSSLVELIVDLICEPFAPNNPVPLYTAISNFNEPVINAKISHKEFSIVAIENYASLLPRESSINFSHSMLPIIIDLFYNKKSVPLLNTYTHYISQVVKS